jgi:hypothetical protein
VVPWALLQTRAQPPQVVFWLRSASQPFAASASQSAKPAEQFGAHKPSAHDAVPCAFTQERPHIPQLATESSVLNSQPFAVSVSQSE